MQCIRLIGCISQKMIIFLLASNRVWTKTVESGMFFTLCILLTQCDFFESDFCSDQSDQRVHLRPRRISAFRENDMSRFVFQIRCDDVGGLRACARSTKSPLIIMFSAAASGGQSASGKMASKQPVLLLLFLFCSGKCHKRQLLPYFFTGGAKKTKKQTASFLGMILHSVNATRAKRGKNCLPSAGRKRYKSARHGDAQGWEI